MPAKSTNANYGAVAISIHWISAVLIIAALISGFRAANATDLAVKVQVLSVHAPLAIAVVFLTLGRLAWWWFADKKPSPLADTPNWQHKSASAVHWLFYIVIFGMGASGIGMLILSGAGPMIFGGAEGQLPDFWNFKPRIPHAIGARLMVILLFLHIGAALYHHFILRDGILKRMRFGSDKELVEK